MKTASLPLNEMQRLSALHVLKILDTPPEERFDRITRLAQRLLDVPVVLISLVDEDRQWFKSRRGLAASETPRAFSFCAHAILQDGPFVIPDALLDTRFADNPLVTGDPIVRSYAGEPIRTSEGVKIGTLCAIDHIPRTFSDDQLSLLKDLSALVEDELRLYQAVELQSQLAAANTALEKEITERERLEESLHLLNRTVAAAQSGICIADARQPDLPLIFVNAAFEQLTGYTAAEAIGRNCRFLQGTDTAQPELDVLRASLRNGQPCTVQLRNYHKDGNLFWNELNISALRDANGVVTHFVGIQTDVSERVQAEKTLHESETRFRSISATMPGAIYQFSAESGVWRMDFIAPSIQTIAGVSDVAITQDINALIGLFHPDDVQSFTDSVVAVLDSLSPWSYEGRLIHKTTGELRWWQGSSIPIRTETGKVVFNGVLFDITERKQAEAERERLIKELQIANRFAKENSRLKSEFLSTMSHELRTPLNAIEGFTSIMLGDMGVDLTPQAQRMIERVSANSKRLLHLINDFLDLSRIEAGRLELVHAPFSPMDLVDKWRTQVGVLGENKQLAFTLSIDPLLPTTLYGDEEALSKIVINLLSNAFKFTSQGSVSLTLRQQETTWAIEVSDTGIGIPLHAREYIFDEFRQVDNSSKRLYGGTGLGLTIVQKLARAMSGTITVKSEVGQGSTFTVMFPLQSVSGVAPKE